VLAQALLSGASGQLRNMATSGGNPLQRRVPCSRWEIRHTLFRTKLPYLDKPRRQWWIADGLPARALGRRDADRDLGRIGCVTCDNRLLSR